VAWLRYLAKVGLTRLTCPSTVARPPHRAMPALLVAAPFCLVSVWVLAADGASRGPSEVIFLLEIIALLVCGRLMGELMQRIGQPAVMGQLIAGILLGPSVLGVLWPEMSATTTFAPSAANRRASASPMPWAPPVTIATLSFSRMCAPRISGREHDTSISSAEPSSAAGPCSKRGSAMNRKSAREGA